MKNVQRIGFQLIQALADMERKGVVHRDLKPANIVQQNEIIKVIDFGCAMKFYDKSKIL